MPRRARREVLDHLGLVAGMFDGLGIGDVLDQVLQHTPETRMVTVGSAVKAMGLNGLGLVNQQLSLGPMVFQNQPTPRLIAPGVDAQRLHDDTLGRALDKLYDDGVTALYSLTAATAAQRLGLAPTFAPLESPSFPVDGCDSSAEEPDAEVMHIRRGYSRAHRPDLSHAMLDLMVEHQAGVPRLMQPLSGKSSDVQDFGQVVTEHLKPLQTTSGTTDLVADSALYSAETLQQRGEPGLPGITRVPAPVPEAQAVLARAHPDTMAPLAED